MFAQGLPWIISPVLLCLVEASSCFQASRQPCWLSPGKAPSHRAAPHAQVSQPWAAFLRESGLALLTCSLRTWANIPLKPYFTVSQWSLCYWQGCERMKGGTVILLAWFLAPILSKFTNTGNMYSAKADGIH